MAFGHEDFYREALYSLTSFYKFHSDKDAIQVLIYTDNIDYFKSYLPPTVLYRNLDEATITQWKGSLKYIYRLKTKVLQEVCTTYSGNFLFVDTDTVFLKNCSFLYKDIEAGELLLDACEGKLIDNTGGIAKKTRRFLKKQGIFSIPSDKSEIHIDEQFVAWNSGTIGFTNAIEKTLFCVEELIDVLYSKSKLFVVEQIALSYYFQKIKEPKATKDFIHHYWDFKEYRTVLTVFFTYYKSKTVIELIIKIDAINPEVLAIEKRKYKKMSFFQKQWRRITTGKKWVIPDYHLE